MNIEKRKKQIEEFIHSEQYLRGLSFQVVMGEEIQIRFKNISKEQTKRLRQNLADAACDHIQVINLDQKQAKEDLKKTVSERHNENDLTKK
jgi:hypothetical protein